MEHKFPSLPPQFLRQMSFWRKPDAATPKKAIRTPRENAIPQPAAQAKNLEQRIAADFLAMKSLPENHSLRRKIESKIALKAAQMEQLSGGKEITDAQAFRALWISMAHTHQGQHPLTRDIQKAQEQLLMESLSEKSLSANHALLKAPALGHSPKIIEAKKQRDALQNGKNEQTILLDGIGRGVELARAVNLAEQVAAANRLVFESSRMFPTDRKKLHKTLVIAQQEVRYNEAEAASRAAQSDHSSSTNNSFDSNLKRAWILEKPGRTDHREIPPAHLTLAITMQYGGRA